MIMRGYRAGAQNRGSVTVVLVFLALAAFLFLTLFYLKGKPEETPPLIGYVQEMHALDGVARQLVNRVRHVPLEDKKAYGKLGGVRRKELFEGRFGRYAGMMYSAGVKEELPGNDKLFRHVNVIVHMKNKPVLYEFLMTSPGVLHPPVTWSSRAIPLPAGKIELPGSVETAFNQADKMVAESFKQHLLSIPLRVHLAGELSGRDSCDLSGFETALAAFKYPSQVNVPALALSEVAHSIRAGRYQDMLSSIENLSRQLADIPEPYQGHYRYLIDLYRAMGLNQALCWEKNSGRINPQTMNECNKMLDGLKAKSNYSAQDRVMLRIMTACTSIVLDDVDRAEGLLDGLFEQHPPVKAGKAYFSDLTAPLKISYLQHQLSALEQAVSVMKEQPAEPVETPVVVDQEPSSEPVQEVVEVQPEPPPTEPGTFGEGFTEQDSGEPATGHPQQMETITYAAPTDTVSPQEELGDLNSDGVIVIDDYIFMEDLARLPDSLTDEHREKFDLNHDGQVDRRDSGLLYWRTDRVGDMDGDYEISEDDIETLTEFVGKYPSMDEWEKPEDISQYDVNKDGKISSMDYYMLKRKYDVIYLGRP